MNCFIIATVNDISLRSNDLQCVTASDDGSCIVWDLQRFVRGNIMYAQTYFKAVAYFNDESQILTTGSDRKVLIILYLCEATTY